MPYFPEPILTDFPIRKLVESKNIHEFILSLEGSVFQRVLNSVQRDYIETKSLFPLELAIDRHIYQRLLDMKSFMNARDRRILERLIGIEIDLKNLEWIGRFKKYYDLTSAQIADYLLPYGYRLGVNQIRESLAGESLSSVLIQIIRGMRVDMPAEIEEDFALEALDQFLKDVLMREARRVFGEFPFSVGSILGYFYLMRLELNNLRTLVQAKLYEYPPERTENLLYY